MLYCSETGPCPCPLFVSRVQCPCPVSRARVPCPCPCPVSLAPCPCPLPRDPCPYPVSVSRVRVPCPVSVSRDPCPVPVSRVPCSVLVPPPGAVGAGCSDQYPAVTAVERGLNTDTRRARTDKRCPLFVGVTARSPDNHVRGALVRSRHVREQRTG